MMSGAFKFEYEQKRFHDIKISMIFEYSFLITGMYNKTVTIMVNNVKLLLSHRSKSAKCNPIIIIIINNNQFIID